MRTLVASDALDAELGALIWLIAERGIPLVIVGTDRESAEAVRRAFVEQVRMAQPARDAVAGGVVMGRSLEDVLRVMGGTDEITDDARDLGVVLVLKDSRVEVAHYVRPVERDAAGHLQRRPPGVLSARNSASGTLDHFYWASTEELATRVAMERGEFENAHDARTGQLRGFASQPNARN